MLGETTLASLTKTLAATWQQWAQVGKELAPADWQVPTRCPGWNVAAQFAHVCDWPALLAGIAQLPDGTAPTDESAAALLLRVNPPGRPADDYDAEIAQDAIAKAKTLDPGTLTATFENGSRALAGQLEQLDGNPVVKFPGLDATVRLAEVVRIAVMEAFVHLLDVTDALDRPRQFPPAALSETVALFFPMCQSVEFVEAATGRSAPSMFPLMK